MDQKAADSIVALIDEIDKNSLTADDTSVQAIRDKYDKLSEAQKVSNEHRCVGRIRAAGADKGRRRGEEAKKTRSASTENKST